MIAKLRKASPPILLMAILLFAGIGYSIYKAASAFSVEVDSPAYDRTPSDVIVSPELETVIPQNDPVAIRSDREGFRLPDRALFDISSGTEQITKGLEEGTFSGGDLEDLGYPSDNAYSAATRVDDFYDRYRLADSTIESAVSIKNDSSYANFAQSVIESKFIPDDGGEISTVVIYVGWIPQEDRWVPVSFSQNAL